MVLKHNTIKEKTSLLKGENYKEENHMPLEQLNSLSLGLMNWDSLLPKEADGHFGWNLFDGKIVELDYEKAIIILARTLQLSGKNKQALKIYDDAITKKGFNIKKIKKNVSVC